MIESLTPRDAGLVLDTLPSYIIQALKEHPRHVVLAGGCILSVLTQDFIRDIDLFVPNQTVSKIVYDRIQQACLTIKTVVTDRAVTLADLTPPVQIIHKVDFQNPYEVIESFDFTICKAAIWWDETRGWVSACDPRFYLDMNEGKLIYCGNAAGKSLSIQRVLKYERRGYQIDNLSFARVIAETVCNLTGGTRGDSPEDQLTSALINRLGDVTKSVSG